MSVDRNPDHLAGNEFGRICRKVASAVLVEAASAKQSAGRGLVERLPASGAWSLRGGPASTHTSPSGSRLARGQPHRAGSWRGRCSKERGFEFHVLHLSEGSGGTILEGGGEEEETTPSPRRRWPVDGPASAYRPLRSGPARSAARGNVRPSPQRAVPGRFGQSGRRPVRGSRPGPRLIAPYRPGAW